MDLNLSNKNIDSYNHLSTSQAVKTHRYKASNCTDSTSAPHEEKEKKPNIEEQVLKIENALKGY